MNFRIKPDICGRQAIRPICCSSNLPGIVSMRIAGDGYFSFRFNTCIFCQRGKISP